MEIGLREIGFVEINPSQIRLVKIHGVQIWLEGLDIRIVAPPGIPKDIPGSENA